MSTRVEVLDYKIHLTDKALLATLQATTNFGAGGPGMIILAPDDAALLYSAPILSPHEPFVAPGITSEWFAAGQNFPTNVKHFERKSGGLFGISWLFGKTVSYYWRGTYVLAPDAVAVGETGGTPAAISQRRWIDGFELIGTGLGGQVSGVASYGRHASRHVNGLGLIGQTASVAQSHNVADYAVIAPSKSWERFYLRPSVFPTVNETVWRTNGSVEALTGVVLGWTTLGQLTLSVSSNIGGLTLIGTAGAALERHRWYRVDVLVEYGAAAKAKLYLDGTLVLNVAAIGPAATGMATAGRTHVSSTIGGPSTGVLHYDDWICAEWPATLDGLDWTHGSHVQAVPITGFDGGANAWVGDWRYTLQDPVVLGVNAFTSATSGGRLGFALTTDPIDTEPNSLGIVAAIFSAYSYRGAAASGALTGSLQAGVITAAGALVQTASPTLTWQSVMWRPAGLTAAQLMGVSTLVHTKAVDASASQLIGVRAVVEAIGLFGDEDRSATAAATGVETLGPALGVHNAPYPRTPWATRGAPPQAPVVIHSGTFVGNDTGQDLVFRCPVHFLWIRPVTGDVGGARWWSSMLGAHFRTQASGFPAFLPNISGTFVAGSLAETVSAGDHTDVVERVKADLVARAIDLSGDCGAFEITKRVAWQLKSTGGGLLDKPTGANCQGYATDIICYADGSIFDVIVNAGTDNTPAWQVSGAGTVDPSRYRAPIDPGDDVPPTPGGAQQQQTVLHITGNNTQGNAVGVTYHYLAICDPGMRFVVNGALDGNNGAIDIETPLVHETFLADGGFFWREKVTDASFNLCFYKGPGAAAASVTPLEGVADVANALTIAAGLLTSKSAFHADAQQVAYALFRRNDGSGDPGVARVVCIQSYIGDGNATRTLALLPASGRRPLFAIIAPHNGIAITRDASHTGTTSSLVTGAANAATGITAGAIDSLSVGIALNANGIVYDVFVTFAGTDACNNGWGCDGEYIPVDPRIPPDGPWDPPPTDPEAPPDGPPVPEPEDPTLPPDFQGQCLAATTKLVNLAISRLGQSVQVVDLAHELTPAAVQARLHYIEALEATLRDFPWPFATRYATPVWVAGTATVPVNDDWGYSYRAPADLLFARRFVTLGRVARGYDAVPTSFRMGSDATGKLIYSGALPADARLEYTIRVTCAATQGDADFRSAFCWRLAHELAPTLCRDEKKVAMAWAMYERQIGRAKTVAANESQPDQQSPDAPWIDGRN